MSVHLINPFVVPADREEEYLKAWNYTTYLYSQMPGFVKTHLHKNTGATDKTFQYINVAEWASDGDEGAAHERHKPGEESIPTVEHHPGTFDRMIAVRNLSGRQETNASVYLINTFIVSSDREAEFLQGWNYTAYLLSQEPGFIETQMHKNNGSSDTTFLYVNIATWESAESVKAAHAARESQTGSLPDFEHHAGIFHRTFSVIGQPEMKVAIASI